MTQRELAVILHGGAGRIRPDLAAFKKPVMERALSAAWKKLVSGAPSEEAVVAALTIMEDDEHFNAGFGGYPNVNGIVLLDVGLMRGNGDFISLINVRRVKRPSLIALDMLQPGRSLMTLWTHQLMQELEAASQETRERYGLVSNHDALIAPYVKRIQAERSKSEVSSTDLPHGTIGCVARDARGVISAGTSTGGVSMKTNGRVGDSPIIGGGVFADSDVCGLSTSGHGESFLQTMVSGYIIAEMRRLLRADSTIFHSRERLNSLLETEMHCLVEKTPGRGGIIVLPKAGPPAFMSNADMFAIAYRRGTDQGIAEERVDVVSGSATMN